MIFLKTNLKKGSDVMSKKNENINEEVKNAEETAEDIKDTETKEEASKETEETKEAAADDKIAELEASVADWKDKYQRLMAEFENARKRTAKEATQRYDMGAMGVLEKLLPVIDNFERAIKMDDDNLEDEVSKFLSGFKMIYSNLALTLQNFEVKAIDGANKPFDPVYHDAVMTEHRDDLEPGMIIEVLQKGYMLKDRVIRPAMVKVSE